LAIRQGIGDGKYLESRGIEKERESEKERRRMSRIAVALNK